jgi:cell shape-determining protein MreC
MLRIFLILSLAVALAGVGFSFVLKDKVQALSQQRDDFAIARDNAIAAETAAREAQTRAETAEKSVRAELETTQQELVATSARLNASETTLSQRSQELEETKVARDIAQRELARWRALGPAPEEIANLMEDNRRLRAERDVFAEEKQVMGREIARLNEELQIYRGEITEIQMPDVRGRITSVNPNYDFVVLNVGVQDGLKKNGKMIVTRGDKLVAKVQLVRVEPNSAVANLLPDWTHADVQAGDQVMTSYEALSR